MTAWGTSVQATVTDINGGMAGLVTDATPVWLGLRVEDTTHVSWYAGPTLDTIKKRGSAVLAAATPFISAGFHLGLSHIWVANSILSLYRIYAHQPNARG